MVGRRHDELTAQGFTPRFTAGGARLEEARRQYEELGFEVVFDEPRPREGECAACLAGPEAAWVVYTRPGG